MRVVQPRPDIQRRVIVRDVNDGALAGRGTLGGVALRESRYAVGSLPQGLAEDAVDGDGLAAAQANRAHQLRRGQRRRRRIDGNSRRRSARQSEKHCKRRRHMRPELRLNGDPGRER